MTRLAVPARVGVELLDDAVYIATLPAGPIIVLDGIAAYIWTEALKCAREELAERVAATTGASLEEVGAAVSDFIDDLIGRGLLREVAP